MLCMSIIASMAPLPLPVRNPPLCVQFLGFFLANKGSLFLPFGGLGLWGGHKYMTCEPFQTVTVFRDIEMKWTEILLIFIDTQYSG